MADTDTYDDGIPDLDDEIGVPVNLDDNVEIGGNLATSLKKVVKAAKGEGKPAKPGADDDGRQPRRERRQPAAEADLDDDEDEEDLLDGQDDEDEDDLDDEDEEEEDDEDEEELAKRKSGSADPKGPVDLYAKLEAAGLGGIAGKYDTTEKLADGLINAARLVGARDEDASYWQRLKEDEGFQRELFTRLQAKFGATQPAGPAPDAAAAAASAAADKTSAGPRKPAKEMPVFNPEWHAWIADGKIRDNAPADVVTAIRKWETDKRAFDANPNAYVDALVEARVADQVDALRKEMEARFGKQDETSKKAQAEAQQQAALESYGEDLLTPHKDWLFVNGDDKNGLTNGGAVFMGYLREAASKTSRLGGPRYPDLADRVEYAFGKTQRHFAQAAGGAKPAANGKSGRDDRLNNRPGGQRRRGTRPSTTDPGLPLDVKLRRTLKRIKTGGDD